MPSISVPSEEKNWQVSYDSDYAGTVIDSCNMDFYRNPMEIKPTPSVKLLVDNSTLDTDRITKFLYTNFDKTNRYVAVAGKVIKSSSNNLLMATWAYDTLTNSPTGLIDADAIVHYKNSQGYDVLLVSEPAEIARFDTDVSTTTWNKTWWSGTPILITATSDSTPVYVTTAVPHGYVTGDRVVIRKNAVVNGYKPGVTTAVINFYLVNNGAISTGVSSVTLAGHLVDTTLNHFTLADVGKTVANISTGGNTATIEIFNSNSDVTLSANIFVSGQNYEIEGPFVPEDVNRVVTNVTAGGTATIIEYVTSTHVILDKDIFTNIGQDYTINLGHNDLNRESDNPWTITVAGANTFSLDNSSEPAQALGTGGYVYKTYDVATHTVVSFGNPALDSNYPIIFCKFWGAANNLCFVCNKNNVSSVDGDNNCIYHRIVFDDKYYVKWATSTRNKVYFGLAIADTYGNYKSAIVEYDPLNELGTIIEEKEGNTIGFIDNNIQYIITERGSIKYFDGSSFLSFAKFPINRAFHFTMTLPHRNAIDWCNDNVNILMPWSNGQNSQTSVKGGVWALNIKDRVLYFKDSFSSSANGVNNSYASILVPNSYALMAVGGNQYYLASAVVYALNGGTGGGGMFYSYKVSTGNRGWIITPKISFPEIDTQWKNLLIKYTSIDDDYAVATGKIVVKYRIVNSSIPSYLPVPVTTWNSATQFTISNAYTTNVVAGDEVFVVTSSNSGLLAHILSITGTTTKTITLDEGITGAAPTGGAVMFSNWKRLNPNVTSVTQMYYVLDLPDTSQNEWIQFKVEVRDGFVLEKLQLGYQKGLTLES